jgi:ABC-type sugar transport system permease subunit
MFSEKRGSKYGGYVFVLPLVSLLSLFMIYSSLATFYYAFTRWDGIMPPVWMGVRNFQFMFRDKVFWIALKNNLLILLYAPLWLVLPLILASLLREQVTGWKLFRTVYFLPHVLSPVIVGTLFGIILRLDGPVNSVLRAFGAVGLARNWLGDPRIVVHMVALVRIWLLFGFGTLVFLAGLSAVPESLYDAAKMDGASWWQTVWHVTLPALRFQIEFWLVLYVITVFARMFDLVFIMTKGGPGYYSYVLEFGSYMTSFRYRQMGYGSAWATFLFVIILVAAVIQVRLMREGKKGEDATTK